MGSESGGCEVKREQTEENVLVERENYQRCLVMLIVIPGTRENSGFCMWSGA